MSDLVTQSRALMESRQRRGMSRELAQIRQTTEIVTARHIAAVDVVESVTEAALLATAQVGALEAHLVGLVPHAEPRLRHIAESGAMSMGHIVAGLARS